MMGQTFQLLDKIFLGTIKMGPIFHKTIRASCALEYRAQVRLLPRYLEGEDAVLSYL